MLKLILGVLAGVVVGWAMSLSGWDSSAALAGGIAAIVAFWWLSNAAEPAIPALLPIAIYPLLGVLDAGDIGVAFSQPIIWLLLGGFAMAQAIQNSGAHRRIALSLVSAARRYSSHGAVLVAAFGLTSALVSMWLVNTATTVMLVPVVLAVCQNMSPEQRRVLEGPLFLAIAYSATIGGMSTPIGTVPNAVFIQQYALATGDEWGFVDWMGYGLPVVLVGLPLVLAFLVRKIKVEAPKIPSPGPWQRAEVIVLAMLSMAILAWLTRTQPYGGWREWLDLPGATSASVALVFGLLLFLIRVEGKPVLKGEDVSKLRWDVLLLMAGGLCLASALGKTGITDAIARPLLVLGEFPLFALILTICLLVTFLTEITSNTATTILFMPLLASVALKIDMNPMILMLPAALSASCAFMMPVATPPNAVIAGVSPAAVEKMPREGFVINLMMSGVIATMVYFLGA